ncbi:proto-oncogene serine/threonine-protein kinase mos [Denticeps clupeoides]|uniref:non-specific serine/threonine protein kinase n=1 Tax=Denticeps clupeoides TaxID=299321 RepID=A0AAY4E1J4_9TELE|nr:proto-oncogene serine/threonine-protein kinase mos [Denticeps clupeoides]
MPSPVPPTRLLPPGLGPSVGLGPCSSPLGKYAGARTLPVPAPAFPWSSVIHWAELRCLEPLGSGGFGSVYKGEYFGRTVAVKKVRKHANTRLACRRSFWAELNAARLSHANLVRVLAASAGAPGDGDHVGTVLMEFAGAADLQRVIYGSAEPLPPARCVKYSTHIARGLRYLHAHRVAHLDLKPANVLVSDADVCKLGDFGCSLRLDGAAELTPLRGQCGGTYTHRAPELLRGGAVTLRADVYSFAITLWQLLTRETPYAGGERQHVLYAVVAYGARPCVRGERFARTALGRGCARLLGRCWSAEPERRPSAGEIEAELGSVGD